MNKSMTCFDYFCYLQHINQSTDACWLYAIYKKTHLSMKSEVTGKGFPVKMTVYFNSVRILCKFKVASEIFNNTRMP